MEPRNYLLNASATPPTKPAAQSSGYPQAAEPGVNEATTPGPFWFYKIGEALRAVITASGATPDDDNLNQLLEELQGGFGLAKSLSSAGYITLPGGLIFQWGAVTLGAGASEIITLNISFPAAALKFWAQAQISNDGTTPLCFATDPAPGGNQFTVRNRSTLSSGNSTWYAIGY